MLIHLATGLWLTMLGAFIAQVFSPRRETIPTSFPDFAPALNLGRRCRITTHHVSPRYTLPTVRLSSEGSCSKERSTRYEKRNYHQLDRKRNSDCDH
jgi:hypothetical protein